MIMIPVSISILLAFNKHFPLLCLSCEFHIFQTANPADSQHTKSHITVKFMKYHCVSPFMFTALQRMLL